ncbi:hypothetical protein EJ04DRAFT_195986 [Polyplosphaeria fusca]|uniref:Uncharacterized protein n=1 Tax=Polyplosphaeria fusca TaxID=682080 RepID=A0A9P4V0N9_9PLEO|nr:hypothetical protein EJ04DRAFT_195986 [Polyplosphaeria fusca]
MLRGPRCSPAAFGFVAEGPAVQREVARAAAHAEPCTKGPKLPFCLNQSPSPNPFQSAINSVHAAVPPISAARTKQAGMALICSCTTRGTRDTAAGCRIWLLQRQKTTSRLRIARRQSRAVSAIVALHPMAPFAVAVVSSAAAVARGVPFEGERAVICTRGIRAHHSSRRTFMASTKTPLDAPCWSTAPRRAPARARIGREQALISCATETGEANPR